MVDLTPLEESKEDSHDYLPNPDEIHEISHSIWEFFRDEGELGKGGYGKIFSVVDKRTDKSYAMKMMKLSDARVFVKELKCLRILESETNIVNYFGVYRDPWFCYLLMEKSISGDLYEYSMANNAPTDELDVIKMGKAILQSIKQCHENNICHRDVKPENFLLFPRDSDSSKDESGIDKYEIKLIDFGMSEFMESYVEDEEFQLDICRDHAGLGTISYLSPEIVSAVAQKKTLSSEQLCKSDIWAAGATIFFLYTQGFHAFSPEKPENDEASKMNTVKRLISEGNVRKPYWMSMDIWELISNLLRHDINERISVANAMELSCFSDSRTTSTDLSHYLCVALKELDSLPEILVLFSIQFFSRYFQEMDSFPVLQWMINSLKQISHSQFKSDFYSFEQFKLVLNSLSQAGDELCSIPKAFDAIRAWDSSVGLRRSYRDGVSVNHFAVLMLLGQFLSEPQSLKDAVSLFKELPSEKLVYFSMEDLEEHISSSQESALPVQEA